MMHSKQKRQILEELMRNQNEKCFYCDVDCFIGSIEQRINKDIYDDIATIEHLVSRYNPNRVNGSTLVMACNKCNKEMAAQEQKINNKKKQL